MEEAQRAINAAHTEAESIENGVGVVKLMGRYSGKSALLDAVVNGVKTVKGNETFGVGFWRSLRKDRHS